MKLHLTLLFALWVTSHAGYGDETTRRLQEELRKRNLYFGEIDGQASGELQKALCRYQQVKGFTISGAIDTDTAASLGLSPMEPDTATPSPLPDEPVLKSDAARELTPEELKIVEQILPADLPPAPIEGPWLPAVQKTTSAPPLPPSQDGMHTTEFETFLKNYLAACETNDLDAEMAFYAPAVDYFDHGIRNHDFIRSDVARYYRRWPKRHYEIDELRISGIEKKVLHFRLRFTVSGEKTTARGHTENRFEVSREGKALKFTSLKEQRLRDSS